MSLKYVFPGGRFRRITIAATAGNVTANQSPGANRRWKILRGRIVLVNGVGVANRQIGVHIQNAAGAIVENFGLTTLSVASQTAIISLGEAIVATNLVLGAVSGANVASYLGIQELILDGTDILRFYVDAGLAADSYSGYLDVLEMEV